MAVVTPPTVTSIGTPPTTADPTNFDARADALLGTELPALVTEVNALGANVYANATDAATSATNAATRANAAQASATLSAAQVTLATAQAVAAAASAASALAAPDTSATSTTSITPGTGSKVFTTQSGKAFAAAQSLVIRSAAEPRQFMVGLVTSYSSTTLTVNVTAYGQGPTGGASADWNIAFWGTVPAAAKPGQVLRLNGATPEWGDNGGEAVQILSTENLHLYSKGSSAASLGTITADDAIASDGTKTASTFTGANSDYAGVYVTVAANEVITYSREYKAGSANTVRAAIAAGPWSEDYIANVDLDTGAVTDVTYYNGRPTRIWSEYRGNGWWRINMTIACKAAGSVLFYTSMSYGPGGTFSILLGRSQLRRGYHPGLYVATTGAAASGAGARKRNRLADSKEIDTSASAIWALAGVATRVGKTVSPIGDLTATVYGASGVGFNGVPQGGVLDADTQYTLSMWGKLIAGTAGDVGSFLYIEYNNGTGSTANTPASSSVPLTNEWVRHEVTFRNYAACANVMYTFINVTAGVGQIAVWGAQLEKGPVASNLIVTGASYTTDGQHADIENRRLHLLDTTYAAVDIAPPSDMQPGDWFEVVDVGGAAATNNITILRGPYGYIAGVAEDFTIDVNKWSGRFTLDAEKGLVVS